MMNRLEFYFYGNYAAYAVFGWLHRQHDKDLSRVINTRIKCMCEEIGLSRLVVLARLETFKNFKYIEFEVFKGEITIQLSPIIFRGEIQ